MADQATKRKRVKLSEGDLFELVVPDGRFGYGIIVKRGDQKNGGTPYIAVFGSIHDERPDLAQLVGGEVALAGWTTDALIYHDRWKVIAHGSPLPRVPLPNFKVGVEGKVYATNFEGKLIGEATPAEQELLDYQFNRAPIGFQNAFEALHGFSDWQEHYEQLTPTYARARMTRPAA